MSISESLALSEVTVLPLSNTINVRWDRTIESNGEIISVVPYRKAYSQEQAAEFESEVEGAAAYLLAIGW